MMMLPVDKLRAALDETSTLPVSGRVTGVGGLLVEGTLPDARMGMSCAIRIAESGRVVPAEIVALRGDTVSLMPLESVGGVTIGSIIEPRGRQASVGVGDNLLGRVVDGWGNPIDGGPPIDVTRQMPLYPAPLNPMERGLVEQPLPVGLRCVDGVLTSGQGQRVVVMAGAGVGKSTLLAMMARATEADVTVLALVGERSREVKRFVESELGPEGLKKAVVVSATSNMAAALRIRAARVATSIAEHYRDQGKRVLLLMDSLTRVCMAQRELGLAIGEPPTTRGYPPSSFAIIPELCERAGMGTGSGSITAFYTALLEGDDLSDPIGDAIRAVTDGHLVLNRRLAEQGHYPAIDVLQSTSRVMDDVTDERHQSSARDIRRALADLREVEELITFGAYREGEVPHFDRALAFGPAIRGYLQQPVSELTTYSDSVGELNTLVSRFRAEETRGSS
jgi:FliI/YscN family ATPase